QGAITADGGVPPYLWALAGGSLPNGLGLDPVTGVISGSSSGAGPFSFTVQVSDLAGAIFSRQFSLTVAAPAMPTLSLGSVPEATSAAQQVMVDLNLEAGYPIPIAGQVRINFVPDPAIGLDDPAVQFASGGRSVSFTIPANSTRPMSPIAFQTGSVAGTIELQIVPNGAPGLSRSVKVVRSAPIIRNLSVVRNANGFDLRLSGLSPSRELTRATVRWTGTGLDTTEVNVPLDSVANAWYRSTASAQFGSQFSLTLPFTVQGDVNAIQSATLTVSNAEGASSALTVDFTGR
ncbi:MAG TPA: Ig domain-containing protein, partial [Bryobacteraceae bacterium]|nr:Ig domain-containing protein [Bryobacteraceae bacterium]